MMPDTYCEVCGKIKSMGVEHVCKPCPPREERMISAEAVFKFRQKYPFEGMTKVKEMLQHAADILSIDANPSVRLTDAERELMKSVKWHLENEVYPYWYEVKSLINLVKRLTGEI